VPCLGELRQGKQGRALFPRSDNQYIKIGRLSGKAVQNGYYKSAHAIHTGLFYRPLIEFLQKGAPRAASQGAGFDLLAFPRSVRNPLTCFDLQVYY